MKELMFKLAIAGCLISLGVNASMQNQRMDEIELQSFKRDIATLEKVGAHHNLLMTISDVLKEVLHLNEGEEI